DPLRVFIKKYRKLWQYPSPGPHLLEPRSGDSHLNITAPRRFTIIISTVTADFMSFPTHRMRRLRRSEQFRSLVRETRLTPESMIYPIFVCPGENVRTLINSMPGQYNLSVDNAVRVAREAEAAGIAGVLLFGIPKEKDEVGSDAYADSGIVQEALRAI